MPHPLALATQYYPYLYPINLGEKIHKFMSKISQKSKVVNLKCQKHRAKKYCCDERFEGNGEIL